MDAYDVARRIVDAFKGHSDASNTLYLARRLENYAESRVVELREMNRLLKEEIRELRLL